MLFNIEHTRIRLGRWLKGCMPVDELNVPARQSVVKAGSSFVWLSAFGESDPFLKHCLGLGIDFAENESHPKMKVCIAHGGKSLEDFRGCLDRDSNRCSFRQRGTQINVAAVLADVAHPCADADICTCLGDLRVRDEGHS